jgi:type I site-specific restriction endonuclease
LPSGERVRKIYVDGVGARIVAERVEYLDENGKLVTESLRDFTKTALKKRFASLDDFLKRWKAAERKQAIIEELEAEGLPLDAITDELGKNLDPFDLICHVAFDKKPLTRRERAENVRKRDVFTKYGPQARAVLDALLEKYRDEGVLSHGEVTAGEGGGNQNPEGDPGAVRKTVSYPCELVLVVTCRDWRVKPTQRSAQYSSSFIRAYAVDRRRVRHSE